MGTIKRFEDIQALKKARVLANEIFKLTKQGEFAMDCKLKDQINGSSGSVMDNIAEGFERDGRAEFIQFLSIAKGSAGECRAQLYRALDRSYITNEKFKELFNEVREISIMIAGMIAYLKKSDLKGVKFKDRVKA
jgi:four helix bundle protein